MSKINELKAKYKSYVDEMLLYGHCGYVLSWDMETEAPNGSVNDRSKYLGELSKKGFQIVMNPDYINTINSLLEYSTLDKITRHGCELAKIGYDKIKNIPENEYVEFQVLLGQSQHIWGQAKRSNNFELFKPYLKKIVEFKRKEIAYRTTADKKGYDILLDDFEPNLTQKTCDKFFDYLRANLVPYINKITKSKTNEKPAFVTAKYNLDKQRKFSRTLMKSLCFDNERGVIKESEHPFTSNFNNTDVRFTVHYYEKDFLSAIFSCLHELGHATYEQQIDSSLNNTVCSGGVSMVVHESQSRMYENIIGRSKEYWQVYYPKLQRMFKANLGNVSLDEFIAAINTVEKTLIRIEADEMTYPLHIMVRYELERDLMSGKLEVDNIEQAWNKKIKDYLGIDVPSVALGVLQDVHWSGGMIGYFPTYAIGSAYAAQLFAMMSKDIDIPASLAKGNTKQINKWLKEKIHRFGSTKYPNEILHDACGDLDPKYYVDYLIGKHKDK